MADILAEILAHKRTEVERAQRRVPLEQFQQQPDFRAPRRDFYGALTAPGDDGPHLIAEVKRKSPSAGVIVENFDPVAIAGAYAQAGAAALSVLTDERYFDGRDEYVTRIRAAVDLPILRKEFIVDPYQVYESRALGADAILLIGEALEAKELAALVELAQRLELAILVEVHTVEVLEQVLRAVRPELRRRVLFGINNRDLKRQVTDLGTTETLAQQLPPGLPFVAESGIKTPADVQRMQSAGACALLVGESLLRTGDPAGALAALLQR